MNIAIITIYQPFTNLGSFLQAYAMKCYLESRGHTVRFVKDGSHLADAFRTVARLRPYRSFFLRFAKAYRSMCDLRQLDYTTDIGWADCCIYGSDEIWNVANPYFRNPLFWGAGAEDKPKVGYAVSVGHATGADFESCPELTANIRSFDRIFSRDEHTHDLLWDMFGVATERVIDPTLLVDRDQLSADIRLPDRKYLLVYTYGIDNRQIEMLRRFASSRGLTIVSPCFWHLWADRTIECSALQFSTLIANAEYVFTTTFHGAVFALINHSRCCILPMREKVANLCRTLDSSERLITLDSSYDEFEAVITRAFPTEAFEANLGRLRTRSRGLLDSELKRIANERTD